MALTLVMALILSIGVGRFSAPEKASAGAVAEVDSAICIGLFTAGVLDEDGVLLVAEAQARTTLLALGPLLDSTLVNQILFDRACAAEIPDGPADPVVTVDLCVALFNQGLLEANGLVAATTSLDALLASIGNLGLDLDLALLVFNGGCAGLVPPAPSVIPSVAPSDTPPVLVDICIALFNEGLLNADGTVAVGVGVEDLLASGILTDSVLAGQIVIEGACADLIPGASASAAASTSAVASTSAAASASVAASASAAASASDAAASQSAAASASARPSFDGDVIEDGVTITALISEVDEDSDQVGTYQYFVDAVQTQDEGDIRYATEGEITFEVLTVIDGELVVIDSGATDENGVVVLDIPEDVSYFVAATDDLGDDYGSDDIPAGQEASVLAIKFVAAGTGTPSASAVASSSAAASASAVASTPAGASASAAASAGGDDDDDNGSDDGDDNGGTNNGGTNNGGTNNGGSTSGGATGLPNTGAGATDSGTTTTWALIALMLVASVVAGGLGLRRRNA
ncbi:MAG TPA: hypothetical protein VGT61_14870 [Thermomicrobiales bacterium]|nr:hypothetical protein [Thermomicrobiales bacterium]